MHVPVKPPKVWQPTAVGRSAVGGVCTLPFPRRAVAVQAGPSPAPGADAAFSPPPAPAASAAHALSDGGCNQTPLAWLQDQCPASTVCQSGPCPGKRISGHLRVLWGVAMLPCGENASSVGARKSFHAVKRGCCCTCHTLSLSICSLTSALALMSRGRSCMNNRCTSLFPLLPPHTSRRHISTLDTLFKRTDHYPSNYTDV